MMRRLASLSAVVGLAACSAEELLPLPPDAPIVPAGGSVQGGSGGSGAASGGAAGASGSASGATAGASSGSAGTESGAGSGGMAPTAGSGGMPSACAECGALKSALVHRYDFEGQGTAVMDRVGTKHGTLQGGGALSQVEGKGVVVLGGGTTGPYVDLPNSLVSSLTNATLETWLTWGGGDGWQRIFDFGDSSAAEDTPGDGQTYLFLTPMTDSASGGTLRGVYSLDGGAAAAETRVSGGAALPQALSQVVLVVDSAAQQLRLFVDGQSAGEQPFAGSLAQLNDVNCWLGRSQYDADPELVGTLHDFRVYGSALTAAQIAASFAGGPDPAFLSE